MRVIHKHMEQYRKAHCSLYSLESGSQMFSNLLVHKIKFQLPFFWRKLILLGRIRLPLPLAKDFYTLYVLYKFLQLSVGSK